MRDVLLPSLADDWARVIAVQLVGHGPVRRDAARRSVAGSGRRAGAESSTSWPTTRSSLGTGRRRRRTPPTCCAAVSAVLGDAVSRDDAAGDEVRARAAPGRQPPPRRGPGSDGDADAVLPGTVARCVMQLERWIGEQRGAPVEVAELRRITTGHSRGNWFLELDDGSRYVVRSRAGRRVRNVGSRRVRVHAGRRSARVPGRRGALAGADGTRRRPAVLRDGLRRGRGRRRIGRTAAWPPSWPSTSCAASMSCTASTGSGSSRAVTERGDPRPDRAVGRRLPLDVAAADPAARGGRRLAAPPRARRWTGWRVVHGDPGPGNFVHDGRRVLAFTDWEFSHLGDPTEDWSFLLSMRGARTMPREEWLTLIRDEVGVEVTPSRCATGRRSTSSRAPAPTARASGVRHRQPRPQHGAHRHGPPADLHAPDGRPRGRLTMRPETAPTKGEQE